MSDPRGAASDSPLPAPGCSPCSRCLEISQAVFAMVPSPLPASIRSAVLLRSPRAPVLRAFCFAFVRVDAWHADLAG